MRLAVLVLLVAVLAGGWGLAIFAAAVSAGLLPLHLGVRRVHLAGAILVPALLSRLTA